MSNRRDLPENTSVAEPKSVKSDPPNEKPAVRKILNSWKEIAAYMGRGLRTVQRYEQNGLPVHRMNRNEGASLVAFSDEIDEWLRRRPMKERPYVRPTLIVLDPPVPGNLSSRKLTLEVERFNVLTAYSAEEAYSTAERFDVDGFVVDYLLGSEVAEELCEGLSERYPKKPIFLVTGPDFPIEQVPACVNHIVTRGEPQELLATLLEVFGKPRLV